MNASDDDYETDDDFDEIDDDSSEALVWRLLQLINPGDEDSALQQFTEYRDAVTGLEEGEFEPVEVVGQVIDWRAGFQVDEHELRALVQAVNELSARWNLSIDWGGDADDDEYYDDCDASTLFATAYDRLAEFGYTLWAWETESGRLAGWMTLTHDGEPMRELATAMHINLRLGSEVS